MTRRIFLKNGSAALASLGVAPLFIARAAQATRARRKILIAIFQRGAADGLNMVVPFGENAYYANRPSIAIPRPGVADGAIDLDGFFGFHPRMAALQPYFRSGGLAIVHACGSPDQTRSHFEAQDYMESGAPGCASVRDGWMNRYLHATEHAQRSAPFRAVALTETLPRTLQGSAPALAAGALVDATGREASDVVWMLRRASPGGYSPANGAAYPRSDFGNSMRQIAQIVKADLDLEVAFAELGQWDHHHDEGGSTGQMADRLHDFATGIAAFATDLGDRMADVVVVTMSEFGRAVQENKTRGTDHGHGNAMLVLGGSVRGGKVYGRWPGLKAEQLHQGRDLAITTDFRDVFAECVTSHLGAKDVSQIFPGHTYTAGLGLIKTEVRG